MAIAASFTFLSSSSRRMKVESEAAPPPALSDTSASTMGLGRLCELARAIAVFKLDIGRLGLVAQVEELHRQLFGDLPGLGYVVVGDGDDPVLISLMSDHGKPCAIDSDSTPSLPSIAESLSTKPRIGSRVVWNTPIMRQS